MVNLLPEKTKKEITALYYARFVSTIFLFAAIVVFAATALLVPSYLLASAEAAAATSSLETSQKAVTLGSSGGVAAQFAVFSERVSILKSYIRPPEVARILAPLSGATPKGVSLVKISITPGEGDTSTVALSGKAATRTALLDFVSALQKVAVFNGVSVPVSALANDANADFSLSFSFNLPHS